jgi:hypothetical protein
VTPLKPISPGRSVWIDGERLDLIGFAEDELVARDPRGASRRFRLVPADDGPGPGEALDEKPLDLAAWHDSGALTEAQMGEAAQLLAHLNEAWHGYRSGDPGRPSAGEPRAQFDPGSTGLGERIEAKARELGCSAARLRRKRRDLARKGISGLADRRRAAAAPGPRVDPALAAAIRAEAAELERASDIRKAQFRARVARRLAAEGDRPIELPSSRQTFNRIVDRVLADTGLFRLPAKSRRSAASALPGEFGSLVAERPGEYVVIDTTRMDVFAIDPFTFQWVGLDLTAALDLCTRSILSFRLTPRETQGVDLALMLADLISPAPLDGRWPADVPYPYCGVPQNLVLRAFELPEGTPLAPRATVRPGTIVVDHGRNYQSVVFMAACEHLHVNVQSARPRRGSDKSWVERFFLTMRERLLEGLPGYTGPNVLARGADVEADAVYLTHELEAIIGRWIALDYQRRPHEGLRPPEAPHAKLTPNEAYEEAVGRSGFLHVPRDPDLHLKLLPIKWRTVQRGGVEVGGLYYDSPALRPYRGRPSPLGGAGGKWPIRVDPRDMRAVHFQDPGTGEWHRLEWRHGRAVERPFGASTLGYVKHLLLRDGFRRPGEEEIATRLARLLHELSDTELFRDRRARREAVKAAVRAEQRTRAHGGPAPEEPKAAPAPADVWRGLEIPRLELER